MITISSSNIHRDPVGHRLIDLVALMTIKGGVSSGEASAMPRKWISWLVMLQMVRAARYDIVNSRYVMLDEVEVEGEQPIFGIN